MFRVTSGLDSMILGEPQVLGQLKNAYHRAVDSGSIGQLLGRLFQHSFMVAKEIRSNTDFCKHDRTLCFVIDCALPRIEVDPETYEVRADGELLVCEPAKVLPLAQRYNLF